MQIDRLQYASPTGPACMALSTDNLCFPPLLHSCIEIHLSYADKPVEYTSTAGPASGPGGQPAPTPAATQNGNAAEDDEPPPPEPFGELFGTCAIDCRSKTGIDRSGIMLSGKGACQAVLAQQQAGQVSCAHPYLTCRAGDMLSIFGPSSNHPPKEIMTRKSRGKASRRSSGQFASLLRDSDSF